MNTKKLVSMSVVAISFLILAGCGQKKTVETTTVNETPQVQDTQVQGAVQNTAKVDATKAQCLEMTAYGMKIALDTAQWNNTSKWLQKGADLEQKFRAENVEYEEACNKFMSDPAFIQEVQKSLQELK